MTIRKLVILVGLILTSAISGVSGKVKGHLPANGVIPDESTAVKVAEAVLTPVFGEESFSKFRPYHAMLKGDVWTVFGTLKPGSRGGTPQLMMQEKDGKVLMVWHSQ